METKYYATILTFLSLIVFIPITKGFPKNERPKQFGPCVGLDCIGKVDVAPDDDDKAAVVDNEPPMVESQDEQLHGKADGSHTHDKRAVNIGEEEKNQEPPTVESQEEYFHGVLMHGDKEPGKVHNHDHNEKPDKKQPISGAETPDEYLHGVLMHGDNNPGDKHADEDRYNQIIGHLEERTNNDVERMTAEDAKAEAARDLEEEKANRGLFTKIWNSIVGEAKPAPVVKNHDIIDDLEDIGKVGISDSHVHDHHPRMERMEHNEQAHVEN